MREVGYTYDWYRAFLAELDSEGRRFRSYGDELTAGDVLLRHDVDLSPERALEVAHIEADLGVRATYFFLCSAPLYNPLDHPIRDVIGRIEALGHDVGLHFSTHQYWGSDDRPDDDAVRARIDAERAVLSAVAADPVEAVSFHIPPEWVLRRTFDGIESTYEPRFFSEIGYYGDSNGRWRREAPRVDEFSEKVQVLTHPGLWGDDDASFEARVREAEAAARARVGEYVQSRYIDDLLG